jgi:hypothetical protein
MPIRNHPLQTLPGGLVFRQFADRLECRFQVVNVEMIAMPADNPDGIEPPDDEIANALLLEKREGEPPEGIKARRSA